MRRIRPNTPTLPTAPAPAGDPNRHAVPSRFAPWLFFLGFALLAAVVYVGDSWRTDGLPPDVNPVSASTESPRYVTKEIREIRIFDWVLARNPELTEADRAEFSEIDPDRWRLVRLQMPKQDGSRLDISLARPLEWLATNAVAVDKTIDLDLPEMGAEGPADVISISACPTPDAKPAPRCRLVTGTFRHATADILDISVGGQPKPIGTTPAHPFWSEDRQAFVPAGKLRQGERLRTAHGEIKQVAKITERPTGEAVYNLEVDVEHVYYVTRNGVLVHNSYDGIADPREYRRFSPGKPVGDHRYARGIGGPDVPENLDSRAWATNARKGALEGQYARAREYYARAFRDAGYDEQTANELAEEVLSGELDELLDDALPSPFSNVFDETPDVFE